MIVATVFCTKCQRNVPVNHVCYTARQIGPKAEYDLSPRFIEVVRMPLADARRMFGISRAHGARRMKWRCWFGHDWQSYCVTWLKDLPFDYLTGNSAQIHTNLLVVPQILINHRCRRCGVPRNPLIYEDQERVLRLNPDAIVTT